MKALVYTGTMQTEIRDVPLAEGYRRSGLY